MNASTSSDRRAGATLVPGRVLMSSLPLARFKVLDLTRARAGPTCVRHLADWGAEVIKVEAASDPNQAEELGGARHGFDFQNLHRNKRSITLDLKQQEGRAI